MLEIRREQMAAFAGAMRRRFERRVAAHLHDLFPHMCKEMGDEAVRLSIRSGVQRAARYGVATEYDVVRSIELTYLLSPDFDVALPWAAAILNGRDTGSYTKTNELCRRAREEAKPASGYWPPDE